VGLPCFSVREELVPELPVILARTGATITLKPVSADEIERGFPVVLVCTVPDGGRVTVSIHRPKLTGPYAMLVVLQPSPPSLWNQKSTGRLTGDILDALRENGATDPVAKRVKDDC
jgi:hypothetical protein